MKNRNLSQVKINRRDFALSLTAATAGSFLAGCTSQQPTPPPVEPSTASPATETYSMVVFLKGSEFFNWSYAGMLAAAQRIGVYLHTELQGPAEWDASLEARTIVELIDQGVAGLIVTAGEANTLVPAINQAVEAGIPVITFDSDSPASQRLCFVGTDNYRAGYEAGKTIADWLDGQGVVAVSTFPGPDHLVKRVQGFKDSLAEFGPEIELAAVINDEGRTDKAETQFTALFKLYPNINAVFAAHGNPGPGIAAAVRNLGLVGQVEIMAFDFGLPVIELIEKEEIKATVGQDPYLMGYLGLMLAFGARQQTEAPFAQPGFGPAPSFVDTGVRILGKKDVELYKTPPRF